MPKHQDTSRLAALAQEWIAAWNAHDVERVLTLYSEDFEMTSEVIIRLGFDSAGSLTGKDKVRAYWTKALSTVPDLHFELIDSFVSPNSVVVHYRNQRGERICEYLRLDAAGKIRQGSANDLSGPPAH